MSSIALGQKKKKKKEINANFMDENNILTLTNKRQITS
jgi:hypothetical protein